MVTKRFDRELFNENDVACKSKAKEILKELGFDIEENPKRYGVDLLVFKSGNHVFNAEVERKISWAGNKFPYENVNFPYRKKKYTELEKPTVFIMFNKDFSNYLCVLDKDLASSEVAEVRNKFVYSKEKFYKVDLNNVSENNLTKIIDKIER